MRISQITEVQKFKKKSIRKKFVEKFVLLTALPVKVAQSFDGVRSFECSCQFFALLPIQIKQKEEEERKTITYMEEYKCCKHVNASSTVPCKNSISLLFDLYISKKSKMN